jgi:hypothetical protein
MRSRAIYFIGALSILLLMLLCVLMLWADGLLKRRAPETFSNARMVWMGEARKNG